MYKTLIVAFIALLCVGCERQSDGKSYSTRDECIRGVVYYESGYKLAPAFKPDGSLYTCDT